MSSARLERNGAFPTAARRNVPAWTKDYAGLLLIGLALFIPIYVWGDSPYYLLILASIEAAIIVATGLNLVAGYTGQVSLGHAGFFSLGGYMTGLLVGRVVPTINPDGTNWIDYLYLRDGISDAEKAARNAMLDSVNGALLIALPMLLVVGGGVCAFLWRRYTSLKRQSKTMGRTAWQNPPSVRRLLIVASTITVLLLVLDIIGFTVGYWIFQNLWASLVLAAVVAALVGYALSLPALRVKGPYLAMVTIAFGIIIVELTNSNTLEATLGGPSGLQQIPPPLIGRNPGNQMLLPPPDSTTATYQLFLSDIILLIAVLVVFYVVRNFVRSRWGRAFIALRENEIGAASVGINVYGMKTLAFVMSAGIAGVGGALNAYTYGFVNPTAAALDNSITFVTMIILGGIGTLYGPAIGAIIITVLRPLLQNLSKAPHTELFNLGDIIWLVLLVVLIVGAFFTARQWRRLLIAGAGLIFIFNIPELYRIGFGITSRFNPNAPDSNYGSDFSPEVVVPSVYGAILLFFLFLAPEGLGGYIGRFINWLLPTSLKINYKLPPASDSSSLSFNRKKTAKDEVELLNMEKVTRDFKGLRAVDRVEFNLKRDQIHALIGPNGAGKTTVLNLISGLYPLTQGRILLQGEQIDGFKPYQIASHGISRTFQNLQVFGDMSILENVMVGYHLHTKQGFWTSLLGLPQVKKEDDRIRAQAMQLLEFVGLADRAQARAKDLPYGYQRLLEIARALAVEPEILLLDEPAAGLNPQEIGDMVRLVRKIKAAGITVLLIEHHMDLVMEISDEITVLDYGKKIAEGDPDHVQNNQKVKDAYFGPEVLLDARS
jgi:branched-chain amino acid transport system permease protein